MKIGVLLPSLLITPRYQNRIFAPKTLFRSLVNGLVDRGHAVYAYTASDIKTRAIGISGDDRFAKAEFPSVKVHQKDETDAVLYRMNSNECEADITMRAFLHAKKEGVDVLHVYHDSLAHYIAPFTGTPVVYTLHDPAWPPETLEGWRFDRFPHDAYVAISRSQANGFGSRLSIVDVVYHGVDVETFPFSQNPGSYLAFVGRLIPEKGLEDALAVSRLLNVPLHIATSENYLKTDYGTRLKNGLNQPNVVLTGFMEKDKRDVWMRDALALVFPIHWDEPFGMVMVEALACGTPVVAYARGSVPEIMKDGQTGYIVSEKEGENEGYRIQRDGVPGLCDALREIMNASEERKQKMRHTCREHIRNNFSVQKMVAGYETVYQKVMETYRAGRGGRI